MAKERGGTGRYVETVTLDAVLGVFETVRGPVVTSADVSDALDCSGDTARRKLSELHREGRVERRETAARVIWWLADDPDAERGRESRADAPEGTSDSPVVNLAGDPESVDWLTENRTRDDLSADVGAAIDGLALDAERRDAVRAMYVYLSDRGTARKSDFTGDVYPEYPAGYGSPGGWWNRLGKDALASLPGVSKPAEGRPTWRFSGE